MAVLELDSPLLSQKKLSGIHEDAVRCIFDERLNRLKYLSDTPEEQLSAFNGVVNDAYGFWELVSKLPEDHVGRLAKVTNKLSGLFDRVVRYAEYHDDAGLEPLELALKCSVVKNAQAKRERLKL